MTCCLQCKRRQIALYFQSLPIGVVGSDGSIKLVEAVVASWSILYVEVVNLQRAMWQCPFLPFIKVGFDVCADLGLVQRGTFEAKIGKVKVLYVYISVATNNLLANQRKLGYGIEFALGSLLFMSNWVVRGVWSASISMLRNL